MRSLIQFVKYNNALPIALFLIFGMGTAAFAASPTAREQVIKSREVVRSVDNTFVVETDFENFDYKLLVTAVAEDDEFYHVSYTYQTISIVDYVWQPVAVSEVLKVGKLEIMGKDLGLYVAKQLGEVLAAQKELLLGTQLAERRIGATVKVVATEYSGLIGKFLDPTEKAFEGYSPIIEEKPAGDRAASVGFAGGFTTGGPAGSLAAAPTLTPAQIQEIVQQKVNAILDAGNLPPPDTGTSTSTPPADTNDDDDTPPVDTPPIDTPPATTTPPTEEDPPAEEPPAEEPPAEEPPAETPPAETPPAQTPPTETPPAEIPPTQ